MNAWFLTTILVLMLIMAWILKYIRWNILLSKKVKRTDYGFLEVIGNILITITFLVTWHSLYNSSSIDIWQFAIIAIVWLIQGSAIDVKKSAHNQFV